MQDVDLTIEESLCVEYEATLHCTNEAIETGGRTLVINYSYALQFLVASIDVNS